MKLYKNKFKIIFKIILIKKKLFKIIK